MGACSSKDGVKDAEKKTDAPKTEAPADGAKAEEAPAAEVAAPADPPAADGAAAAEWILKMNIPSTIVNIIEEIVID